MYNKMNPTKRVLFLSDLKDFNISKTLFYSIIMRMSQNF